MRWMEIINEGLSALDHADRKIIIAVRPVELGDGSWVAAAKGDIYAHAASFEDCVGKITAARAAHGLGPKTFPAPKAKFTLSEPTKTFEMPSVKPKGFADHLTDDELVSYIADVSSDPVSLESLKDHFYDSSAVLRLIPLSQLIDGNPDTNERSASKEKRYVRRSPATIPPLVVHANKVIDGNHRLRVARAQGVDRLWCYDVTYHD